MQHEGRDNEVKPLRLIKLFEQGKLVRHHHSRQSPRKKAHSIYFLISGLSFGGGVGFFIAEQGGHSMTQAVQGAMPSHIQRTQNKN